MSTLDEIAAALGVAPLSAEEQGLLLDVARKVAHGTERRYAPLSTFLVGVAVAGAAGERTPALRNALTGLRAALPAAQDPPGS